MSTAVIRRAAVHAERLRRAQAEYDADVATWHDEGHRPAYCIHGTSL